MTNALRSLGGRVLATVLPDIPVSACIPNDPYNTCFYFAGDDCASIGRKTYWYCWNDCTGAEHCNEVGCCGFA